MLIVAVGAYLRWSYLDIAEFKEDEARVSGLALALARGEAFPLVGNVSSLATTNPAIFVYLMSLPYLFSSSPVVATGFVGLLGVLAVLGCYLLTRSYFGELAALLASFLFAVSPWAVMYSRKIWPQDVLPLFAILFVSALVGYAIRGRTWQITLACVWLALLVQIHGAGATLIPLLLLVLVVFRRNFRWPPLLVGMALSAVTVIPYILWQMAHGWRDLATALNQAGQAAHWDGEAARLVFDSVAARASYAGAVPGDSVLYAAEGGLFILSLGYLIVRLAMGLRSGRRDQSMLFLLLLLWLAAPVLLFSRHSMMLHPYYLLPVYPAQFIVIAILLSDACKSLASSLARRQTSARARAAAPRGVFAAAIVMMAALGVSQVVGVTRFLSDVERGLAGEAYGLPLKYSLKVADLLRSLNATDASSPVYLAASGHDFQAVYDFLIKGRFAAKTLDGWFGVLLPRDGDQLSYVVVDRSSTAAQLMKSSFPVIDLDPAAPSDGNLMPVAYRITSDDAGRAFKNMALRPLSSYLSNGVELVGWQAPRTVRAGDVLSMTVAWRVKPAHEVSSSGYAFFAHLVDGKHEDWGGFDSPAVYPSEWPNGATMVNWYQVPVTTSAGVGAYWLSFGSYDRNGTRRVPISGADGRVVGDSLLLGPVKVIPTSGLPSALGASIQTRQEVWLEDQAELLGFDLSPAVARPGDTLSVVLHWRAGKPSGDYTVFVHLVDAVGGLVAQVDSPPRGGTYPTSLWDQDEYVRDEYRVALPENLAPGVYRISLGMYSLADGQRLRAQVIGDAVELRTTVLVQR